MPVCGEIKFATASAEMVQALVTCISVKEANRAVLHEVKVLQDMQTANVLDMLDFCKLRDISWVGVACADAAVKGSKDPELMLAILERKDKFIDEEAQVSLWQKVLEAAARGFAMACCKIGIQENVISKIGRIDAGLLELIVESTSKSLHGTKVVDLAVPRDGCSRCVQSEPNAHGMHMYANLAKDGAISLHMRLKKGMCGALTIGGIENVQLDTSTTVMAQSAAETPFISKKHVAMRLNEGFAASWNSAVPSEHRSEVTDSGGNIKISYTTNFTALHMRCLVLVRYFAGAYS